MLLAFCLPLLLAFCNLGGAQLLLLSASAGIVSVQLVLSHSSWYCFSAVVIFSVQLVLSSAAGTFLEHLVFSQCSWDCLIAAGIVPVQLVLFKSIWYFLIAAGIVPVQLVLSQCSWYCHRAARIFSAQLGLSHCSWYSSGVNYHADKYIGLDLINKCEITSEPG